MFDFGGDGYDVGAVGIVVLEDEQVFVPTYRHDVHDTSLVAVIFSVMGLHASYTY